MADKPLLTAGPFLGLQASADPYYLEQPYGAVASNVDVSYRLGSFSSALGRSLLGTITLPVGYSIAYCTQFVSFSGDNPVTTRRLFVFSATDGNGNHYQGWFDANTQTTQQFIYCNPFTQAVQFGSALWTNGGNKIIMTPNGNLSSDDWQPQIPANLSYGIFGTYVTQAGNAETSTYTYAITMRRALSWQVSGTTFTPDPDTYQESSPVFTTSVTTAAGQQPAISYLSATLLPVQGTTSGQQQYFGALYRASTLNPTYQFVDYLVNLTSGTGNDGNPCFIDTNAYASIQNNATLTIHHDPPPIVGQTFPGAIANNSSPASLVQSQQQAAFSYTNPAFLAKHKNRMWAFTLYPTSPIGNGPQSPPQRLSLQPQLWMSDEGVPWSFNDDPANDQVQLVGPEDTPGNNAIDAAIATNPPWTPGALEDTPMGLASTGSYLVALKSQSTWIGIGDTPSETILRKAFNIGCISSTSITEAEGGVFWLAPSGVYFFDGGAPQYIGEDVRGIIDKLAWSDLQGAEGSYRDRTFYLSFDSVTLCYYLPAQKWYTRPYGGDLAVWSPANQNELIFISGTQLQLMDVNPAMDLSSPIVSTWVGQLSDSGTPGQIKSYNYLIVRAPQQLGTVAVTLTIDANFSQTNAIVCTFDLSKGDGAHVARLPNEASGYTAQLKIITTTNPAAANPMVINSVVVVGDVKHDLQPKQTQDLQTMTLNGVLRYPSA